MVIGTSAELDFIEELRLRRWARENYVSREKRKASWHPIVLEEMDRKEEELTEADVSPVYT
jgi:hypothetical protein